MVTHKIQAVIFDMDGVLVDSEPFWQQAELEILCDHGVPLTLEDTLKTQGLRIDQVVGYWYQRHPWSGTSPELVADAILSRVVDLIAQQGEALPGVDSAISLIQQRGWALGLATSSPSRLVEATLSRLGLHSAFAVTCSAEHLRYGKPHPQVYLNAADELRVAPEHAMAIEDSFNGLLAAKAARMTTLAVPDPHHRDDPRFVIADHRLDSLSQFTQSWLDALN
ncbi:hexitol phosphatase HxpB [Ferrimonas balearica]|uniref:hexitol phosphatase HxpB n=1 Tax=Ferrimonas balearica TaxID=44012 RepID=UPI001C561DCF|nr:hexitol phosphatase HxpB [Ferrimonas balearica]